MFFLEFMGLCLRTALAAVALWRPTYAKASVGEGGRKYIAKVRPYPLKLV